MPSSDLNTRVSLSVFDRLIDLEPRELKEAPKSRTASLTELKAAVRRDLEWLLNTRCFLEAPEKGLEESKSSVAFYGLPDVTGVAVKNYNEQVRLSQNIELAIRHFEPRFIDLTVTLEPISDTDRALRFRIEARLDVDPAPEPIAFDTVLELGSGDFVVRES